MADDPFRDFRERFAFLGAFGYLETADGVLLVANRRRIDGRDQTVWDLPGGEVKTGETLTEALEREMREETGLSVDVGEMLFVAEGERILDGSRTGVWRSFFFRVEKTGGALDISGHATSPPRAISPRTGTTQLGEGDPFFLKDLLLGDSSGYGSTLTVTVSSEKVTPAKPVPEEFLIWILKKRVSYCDGSRIRNSDSLVRAVEDESKKANTIVVSNPSSV